MENPIEMHDLGVYTPIVGGNTDVGKRFFFFHCPFLSLEEHDPSAMASFDDQRTWNCWNIQHIPGNPPIDQLWKESHFSLFGKGLVDSTWVCSKCVLIQPKRGWDPTFSKSSLG